MIQQKNPCVATYRAGTELKMLMISDVHFDSTLCDRNSLGSHLDEALEKDAGIIVIGDWFDIMGCYKDPRSKAHHIDPELIHPHRSYLDLAVEKSYEFLKKYANNILLMTYGNHETAVIKHRDTDPLDRLIFLLNQHGRVMKGAYEGWLNVYMKRIKKNHSSRAFKIKYHHGKGMGAQRSKGILHSQMDAMQFPDANLIVSGHDHNKIYDPSNVRERVRSNDTIEIESIHWLKLGSYAKRPKDGMGFVIEKGFTMKRMGGWWVDLELKRIHNKNTDKLYISPKIYEAPPIPR